MHLAPEDLIQLRKVRRQKKLTPAVHERNPEHKEEKPRGFQGVPPIFPKEVKSTTSIKTERAKAPKDNIASREEKSHEYISSPSEVANKLADSGFKN